METNRSLDIPNDSLLLFDKRGITGDVIDTFTSSMSSECSSKFHEYMTRNNILSSWDESDKWFRDGFPAQVITSGKEWQKGKLRLRIVAEFIPDDIESEKISSQEVPTSSVSPSLDDIRKDRKSVV